jgi:hypothetical protein
MKMAFHFDLITEHTKLSEFVKDDLILKIEQISNAIARIYFEDEYGSPLEIPSGFSVWDETNELRITPFENSYFLVWSDSYLLTYQGRQIFRLHNTRSWTIECGK